VLVDTHAVLWFITGNRRRLPSAPRRRIESGPAIVSAASLWEIAIKTRLGKLEAPADLPDHLADLGFTFLLVSPEHAWSVRELPDHHRDPFDRLLVAQAQVERVPILTVDPVFDAYDVEVVWD
jgi:PIN domain nuclease of toxin-antitoxin system